MKLGMRLTLDGMVRALRMRAFEMGEDFHEMRQDAEARNQAALALLAAESRRAAMEVDDEPHR